MLKECMQLKTYVKNTRAKKERQMSWKNEINTKTNLESCGGGIEQFVLSSV